MAASVVFGNAAASAADLQARMYGKAPPRIESGYDWSGVYVGVNAGYAFNGKASNTITGNEAVTSNAITNGFVPPGISTRGNGITGGGQIGTNYQFRNGPAGGALIGIEADLVYLDANGTTDIVTGRGFDTQFHSAVGYLGTIRGRIGYAFDRFLVYGTGGLAFGEVNNSMTNTSRAGVTGYFGSQETMRTGYAYGGGIEYALASNSGFNFFHAGGVTVKLEYMHYDLGTDTFASIPVPGAGGVAAGSSFANTFHINGDLVRAGLNYKFGAPVVAKY